eukprot:TRINITY_DN40158_c0_g1_i1.p1 TRINITY_DN40158_c0_g1~~TRINITY_DN40158_c0_g1_i1.p1  ORF type:complete len:724 (-),score=166.58 TRINITY_DN40158_c0_g1_i1:41-2212(-)
MAETSFGTLDDGTELAFGFEIISSDEDEASGGQQTAAPDAGAASDAATCEPAATTVEPTAAGRSGYDYDAAVGGAMSKWCKALSSQFAVGYHYDMLHDLERNDAYRQGIKEAVQSDEDFVLEIGSGSGLLALLAEQSGCQHVFTIEGDPMMATAARSVVAANDKEASITVLPKFSTDAKVGWSADLPCRASVLVAEIFDTPLVGEGVLPSFIDAHRRLLEPDARVVPHRAHVFAVAMRSPTLRSMDRLDGAAYEALVGRPWGVDAIPAGPRPVFQCQATDLLRKGQLETLSEPLEVLTLEFADPTQLRKEYDLAHELVLTRAGPVDGVLMWWTLDMNPSGTVQLSTSPLAWKTMTAPPRYHWQQGASIFRRPLVLAAGESLKLRTVVQGDGWDLLFEALEQSPCRTASSEAEDSVLAFPAVPRPRLWQLADAARLEFYRGCVRSALNRCGSTSRERTLALCLGDGWVGAAAAAAHCDEVVVCPFSADAEDGLRSLLQRLGREGSVAPVSSSSVAKAAEALLSGRRPDVIVYEPFHSGYALAGTSWGMEELSLLWQAMRDLVRLGCVSPDCPIADPVKVVARAFALPEYFRRRQPVQTVEGFDLSPFNEDAPLWRQFEIKRQTLSGWQPDWRTARLESAVDWFGTCSGPTLRLSGSCCEAGLIHGVLVWIEDGGVERDPTDLPLTGCLTLKEAKQASQGGSISVLLDAALPDDIKCELVLGAER